MKSISRFIDRHYPTYGESNVFYYYLVTFFGNAWFQIGNWLLFVLLFMGEREFAVYEAVAFGMGILFEIPSGAFADLLGKKRTVAIGLLMQAVGSVIFIFGFASNAYFFFGNLIIIVAFAFISGSLEALLYDTLVEKKKEEHYDDIIGKGHSLEILTMILAGILGGIVWQYTIYGPWILTALSFFVAFIISFRFTEPKVDTEIFTWRNFIIQNKKGFYYLLQSNFRKYTLSFALISGSFLMWAAGIVRVLMGRDFGYDGTTLNWLISATLVLSFIAAFMFKRIRRKFGDKIGFGILLLIASTAWFITGFVSESLLVGALVFSAITVTGTLSEIWISVILNKHVLSKDRATAISTLSFIVQIPYVLVVVVFGSLIAEGNAAIFYILTGLLLFIGLISFIRAESANIKVTKEPKIE